MTASSNIDHTALYTAEELVKGVTELVSLPAAYIRLKQVMDSEDSSMADVAEVVSLDPALAARLLRIANSAFFGLPSQVDTITRAASILGTRQIHDLALATSVAHAFDGMPNDVMDMSTFWYRSVLCGFMARELGLAAGMRHTETLFLQGLLHDIGHLVLYSQFPEECRHALRGADASLSALCDMEAAMIGCDATEVGATLLESWGLPKSLHESIRHLRNPEEAKTYPQSAAIVGIATWVTHAMDSDLLQSEVLDKVYPWAWETTGLDRDMVEMVSEAISTEMIEAMYKLFAGEEPAMPGAEATGSSARH